MAVEGEAAQAPVEADAGFSVAATDDHRDGAAAAEAPRMSLAQRLRRWLGGVA